MMRIKISETVGDDDHDGKQSAGGVLKKLSMSTSEDGTRIRKQASGWKSGTAGMHREHITRIGTATAADNTGQRDDSEKSMVIALTTYNPNWTVLLNFEADFDRGQQLDAKNWYVVSFRTFSAVSTYLLSSYKLFRTPPKSPNPLLLGSALLGSRKVEVLQIKENDTIRHVLFINNDDVTQAHGMEDASKPWMQMKIPVKEPLKSGGTYRFRISNCTKTGITLWNTRWSSTILLEEMMICDILPLAIKAIVEPILPDVSSLHSFLITSCTHLEESERVMVSFAMDSASLRSSPKYPLPHPFDIVVRPGGSIDDEQILLRSGMATGKVDLHLMEGTLEPVTFLIRHTGAREGSDEDEYLGTYEFDVEEALEDTNAWSEFEMQIGDITITIDDWLIFEKKFEAKLRDPCPPISFSFTITINSKIFVHDAETSALISDARSQRQRRHAEASTKEASAPRARHLGGIGLGGLGIEAGLGGAVALVGGLDAQAAAQVLADARIALDDAKESPKRRTFRRRLDKGDSGNKNETSFLEGVQGIFAQATGLFAAGSDRASSQVHASGDDRSLNEDHHDEDDKLKGDDGFFALSSPLTKLEAIAQLTVDRNTNLQTLTDFLETYCSWCRQHRQTPVSVDNEELQMLGVQVGKNDAGEDVIINFIANRLETRSYSLYWSVPIGVAFIAGAQLAISGLRRLLAGFVRSLETVSCGWRVKGAGGVGVGGGGGRWGWKGGGRGTGSR